MSIQKLEVELEATRQKIAKQEAMIGKSLQSADPRLYEKERMLEQAVIDAHLDAPLVEDGPIDMPSVAPAVMELLTPPVKRFFRDGVEHTLTQEQSNEEIDAFIERKILEEPEHKRSKTMKISKQQFKAALNVAHEAGFNSGRECTDADWVEHNFGNNPDDPHWTGGMAELIQDRDKVVKRIVKHEAKHAKMRKHWNVAADYVVNLDLEKEQ